MVKSACGIEAVYMCFNGTGIWGGETIKYVSDQGHVGVTPVCVIVVLHVKTLLLSILLLF